jgi:hypothetical protein
MTGYNILGLTWIRTGLHGGSALTHLRVAAPRVWRLRIVYRSQRLRLERTPRRAPQGQLRTDT